MAIWPWALGALLVGAALVWLLMRRRSAAPKRPAFDTSRLAASVPTPAPKPASPAAAAPVAKPTEGAPTWHAGGPPPSTPAAAPVPPHSEPAPEPVPAPGIIEASETSPMGHDRIELARAYIELGDVDTARGLLQEVADDGDAATRGEALRLLRELV
jgi:pilus assembly protein FimV